VSRSVGDAVHLALPPARSRYETEVTAVLKLLGRLAILAAIGAAIGYIAQRRRQSRQQDVWDAEDPDGDWGLAQMELQGSL
jgi:hypothetical protein